jgi:hypothetical protein
MMIDQGKWDQAKTAELVAQMIGEEWLRGRDPQVQGAILADLVATWLAGHMMRPPERDDAAINALREAMLADWLDTVRRLIPVNEKLIKQRNGITDDDDRRH